MSQSNIFIDIGNSAIKWRMPYSEVYSESIDNFLSNTLPQADEAWVSSVAHDHIIEDLKVHFNEVHVVKTQKEFSNLKISYDDSSSLGTDRFCAMLGSISHFPKIPLLVIDIGSIAISVDFFKPSAPNIFIYAYEIVDAKALPQGADEIDIPDLPPIEIKELLRKNSFKCSTTPIGPTRGPPPP